MIFEKQEGNVMQDEPSIRIQKVSEVYHHALSELLLKDVQNPNLKGVTITQVIFTPDLRLAKIYFFVSGNKTATERALKGFIRSKGFIKKEMAERVHMKYSPDLRFYYDNSFEEKERIDTLFKKIGSTDDESQSD